MLQQLGGQQKHIAIVSGHDGKKANGSIKRSKLENRGGRQKKKSEYFENILCLLLLWGANGRNFRKEDLRNAVKPVMVWGGGGEGRCLGNRARAGAERMKMKKEEGKQRQSDVGKQKKRRRKREGNTEGGADKK